MYGIARFLIAAMAVAGSVSSVNAQMLNFDFSFTSDTRGGFADDLYPGTVTGRIIGLTNNTTSSASAVYIDTVTIDDPGLFVPIGPSYNTAPDLSSPNQFTVTNGKMTAANYAAGDITEFVEIFPYL